MNILVPDPQCPLTGIETINLHLLPELARLGHKVVWLVPAHRRDDLQSKQTDPIGFDLVPIEWPRTSFWRWVSAILRRLENRASRAGHVSIWSRLRQAVNQHRLNHLVRRHAIDRVLYTWTLGEPAPKLNVPVAALVHDLNWGLFPENFPRSTPETLYTEVRAWLKTADKIFTFSQATRSHLTSLAPQSGKPCTTILLATELPSDRLEQITARSAARTGRTVFYYPATVSAHKNHTTLLHAAALVAARGHDFELVLSGPNTDTLISDAPLSGYPDAVRQVLRSHRDLLASRVRGLGYVSRETLAAEFARADCMVLPSLFEGFGLPLTEGLGWGKQIICSTIAPYAEQITHYQVADWVQVFDPHSVEALANHMENMITRPRPDGSTCADIARRVGRWTWTDVARAYARELA